MSCPPREPGEQALSSRSRLARCLALIIPFPCAVSPIHGVDFDRPCCLLPPAARADVSYHHYSSGSGKSGTDVVGGWSSSERTWMELESCTSDWTEWKRTATSTSPEYVLVDRRETCGPHHVSKANSLCCIHIHTYVSGGTEFVSTAAFRLLVIHPAQKDGGADPISSASFGRRLPCLIPIT